MMAIGAGIIAIIFLAASFIGAYPSVFAFWFVHKTERGKVANKIAFYTDLVF